MKLQLPRLHHPPLPVTLFRQLPFSSSSSEIPNLYSKLSPTTPRPLLTQQQLTKINLLIPRLCLSGKLTTALHLATTSLPLLLNDPLLNPTKALSFSILIHSLTSQPDMTKPMSLLTILKHTPSAHPLVPLITTMLISSFLKKMRPLEALKVYKWLLRTGSCFQMGRDAYGVLVNGLCENGLVIDALKVLRDMLGVGVLPGGGLRKRVYMSLLREALVSEALELDRGLCGCVVEGDNGEGVSKVVGLLDSMVARLA